MHFYMLEENAFGEDLWMDKLLEIFHCQKCKHLNFMKGETKPLEHLKTFFSFHFNPVKSWKVYAYVESGLVFNLRNVYKR